MNIKYLVNLVRTKKAYFYFLIVQLILVIALIFYVFKDFNNKHNDPVAVVLELVMTAIVVIEIVLRISIQKKDFFNSCWNIVDFFTILLIIGLYVAFEILESKSDGTTSNKTYLSILLAIRYVVQIIRILITMEESREMRKEANNTFDVLAEASETFIKEEDNPKLATKMTLLVDDRSKSEDSKAHLEA